MYLSTSDFRAHSRDCGKHVREFSSFFCRFLARFVCVCVQKMLVTMIIKKTFSSHGPGFFAGFRIQILEKAASGAINSACTQTLLLIYIIELSTARFDCVGSQSRRRIVAHRSLYFMIFIGPFRARDMFRFGLGLYHKCYKFPRQPPK